MLFSTSLLALVGVADEPQSSPRKLQIVNTKRESVICDLLFPSSILAVKLNRRTLVIVLETEIYIYDVSNLRLMHVIETTPNPDAIVALSPSSDPSYLAYPSPVPSPNATGLSPQPSAPGTSPGSVPPSTSTPSSASPSAGPSSSSGSSHSGDVLLFSTTTLTVANVIRAHKSPLSFLALSPASPTSSGQQLLATASDKGTVIRVWSVPGAQKLYQFRRGTREARIYSMSFNAVSSLLAVSSAHDTVHVFKLGATGSAGAGSGGGGGGGVQSPAPSEDGSVDGGYEAFIDKKRGSSMGSSLQRRVNNYSKALTTSVGGYLPKPFTEMWEPSRDFAFLRLPSGGARSIVGLSGTMPHVMVISSDGFFYLYSIDLENGGECSLLKQYSLLDSADESMSITTE